MRLWRLTRLCVPVSRRRRSGAGCSSGGLSPGGWLRALPWHLSQITRIVFILQRKPAATDAQQSQPQQPAEEPTHKIKVRGEERDVPLSELKKLAEAGGDYTRQMQALAEQRRGVERLEALGEAMQRDPGLREHLAAYRRQEQAQAAQPPADPIERIKWEAEQTALAKVQEQFGPMLHPRRAAGPHALGALCDPV